MSQVKVLRSDINVFDSIFLFHGLDQLIHTCLWFEVVDRWN